MLHYQMIWCIICIRLGHLKYGESLLLCVGYKLYESFLILNSELYTRSSDLFIIKRIRDLIVYKLECEQQTYKWQSCRIACEAHTIGRRPSMEDDHILIDKYFITDKQIHQVQHQ